MSWIDYLLPSTWFNSLLSSFWVTQAPLNPRIDPPSLTTNEEPQPDIRPTEDHQPQPEEPQPDIQPTEHLQPGPSIEGLTGESLDKLKDELKLAQQQLEAKIEELDEVRLSTTTADKLAVGDIRSLVEALNEEIFQASATIANSLQFPSSPQDRLLEQELLGAREELIDVLGRDMVDALWRARDQEYGPIMVQYALQVAMTGFCERMIHEWDPSSSEANAYLESIYTTIHARETQAAAGRWRALTRATLNGVRSREVLVQDLADRLVNILAIAGSSQAQCQVAHIREQFLDSLVNIAKFIEETRMATGEYITSVDVIVYTLSPGTAFAIDSMEDMFGETVSGDKAIAGTTKLGILLEDWEKDGEQLVIARKPVVKAEVLLADVLFEHGLTE